jgi:NADH-quinone oxidoreductase subunit E
MLSAEERTEIDLELAKYDYKQGASLEALAIVQHHRGYVSDENIKDIAHYLEMSPHELDSIATFYNLIFRKPVGKNVIRICDSISCWIRGYDALREKIKKEIGIDLGGTTSDNNFTMVSNPCLGCCDHAPALMINDARL